MDFAFHNRQTLVVPRPRAFDEADAVVAAKEAFWDHGYVTTSVGDLEEATGLSRSSLYSTFTTKRDLFHAALAVYLETFIDPLLGPLEREGADLREITRYFKRLETLFKEPRAQRGCLLINTMGECAGRDAGLTRQLDEFLDRLRSAFANALRPSVHAGLMTSREATEHAALLGGAVVGVWLTVRVDPASARTLCRSAAAQVQSWITGAY
ncbi:MAG: TetR/AcrR family transcriptional regulator, transcriptional repressor for nem operon [Acidimicrobiaceae bacterium]